MAAKYTLVPAKGGKWCFRLLAGTGETVLASQTYSSRSGARRGVTSVQNHCGSDGCFERKTAKNGKAYFVLKARNGQVIGKSEMYNSTGARENGIKAVKKAGKAKTIAAP